MCAFNRHHSPMRYNYRTISQTRNLRHSWSWSWLLFSQLPQEGEVCRAALSGATRAGRSGSRPPGGAARPAAIVLRDTVCSAPRGQRDVGETGSASDCTLCWGSLPPDPAPLRTQLLHPVPLVGSPHPPCSLILLHWLHQTVGGLSLPVPAHQTWS